MAVGCQQPWLPVLPHPRLHWLLVRLIEQQPGLSGQASAWASVSALLPRVSTRASVSPSVTGVAMLSLSSS